VRVDIEYTSELTIGKTVLSYVGDTGHPPRDTDMTGYAATEWPATWRSMQRPPHNVRLVTHFDSETFIERFVQRMEVLARSIPV
jgi:purine nucleosidase